MKIRACVNVFVVFGFVVFSHISWAQELTQKGFYYPTGKSNFVTTTWWLAMNCDGAGDYITDKNGDEKYHIARDIRAARGDSVYAIADGIIIRKSSSGWGSGFDDNVGLLIRHTLSNGKDFFALYGHITSNINEGSGVTAGEVIGNIGPWEGGTHLHFGIHLGPVNTLPRSDSNLGIGWGFMSCRNWPDTNGFIDPMIWITTQTPAPSATTPVNILDQQAQNDMIASAATDTRFLSAIVGTSGKNIDWHLAWELRWMNFSFSGSRTIRMYHATLKANTAVRYTIFFDPDTNSWSGWSRTN